MKNSVQKKIEAVELLKSSFVQAKTIVSFDYPGLTVDKFQQLRGELRKAGCVVKVHKNNISRRAASLAGFDGFAQSLTGPKAVTYSLTDPVIPAKVVFEFAKTNKEVVIGSGVIEGKDASVADITALANIPSREGLLTQLAVGLLTPVRELAIGLNMIVEKQ